jgi:serine/threonine-protein kinase CTR1
MDSSRFADGSDAGDEPALVLPDKAMTEPCVSDVLVGVEEIPPSALTLQEEIGWGITAKVYRGLHEGRVVAVKHFRDPRSVQDKYFAREVETLRRLKHSNIVRLWGLCQSPKGMQLVIEFCQGGSLFELLHESDVNINLSQQCKMASDTAAGMRYLHEHSPPIVHRDLKSLNLLLKLPVNSHEDVPVVQVADFGVSRIIETGQSSMTMTKGVGTMQWMAPECISSWAYDMMVDVYSYGVCLYEIMARQPPYEELEEHADINSYVVGWRPAEPR